MVSKFFDKKKNRIKIKCKLNASSINAQTSDSEIQKKKVLGSRFNRNGIISSFD